ncbi:3-hydroxyacyl-CoA dehydrogenase family protein [Puia sp. P3]|uniref:3-hydroxyacyl-CoA dehydrogenase family protein n=1 Tax=Puia sp. P3 TaxID=3423952 RepID=UPI003D664640
MLKVNFAANNCNQIHDDRCYLRDRNKESLRALYPAPNNQLIGVKTVDQAKGHPDAELYIDLDFTNDTARILSLSGLLPKPVIVNAVTETLEQLGYPFTRINGWPGFPERSVHELVTNKPDQIKELYTQLGREYQIVPDTPGMIGARILATIINEAWYTWEEEVSTKEEIDTAMKLGTNYPMGPFEWGQRIGLDKIAGLLTVLGRENERYTPSERLLEAAKSLKYD